MTDPRERFSSRVENYIKYRPGYPRGVIETLQSGCGLSPDWSVADVGSGTGLLSRQFLDFGCRVVGVEPNAAMRAAGERLLAGYAHFTSRDGSAEETSLPSGSVELVAVGQAFHWFDAVRARVEFRRILKPGGWVALVWNDRDDDYSPFMQAYEALIGEYNTDYDQINHRNVEASPTALPQFFGGPFHQAQCENLQQFDFEAVRGRLLSSSYTPEPGSPGYAPMLEALRRLFDVHQVDGVVTFAYETQLFYGQLP